MLLLSVDHKRKGISWQSDSGKESMNKNYITMFFFFSVLCAHHGYQFDFLILLSNMERSGMYHSILSQHNIHFADSLLFCREVSRGLVYFNSWVF